VEARAARGSGAAARAAVALACRTLCQTGVNSSSRGPSGGLPLDRLLGRTGAKRGPNWA
jgi:hypothetical protein